MFETLLTAVDAAGLGETLRRTVHRLMTPSQRSR